MAGRRITRRLVRPERRAVYIAALLALAPSQYTVAQAQTDAIRLNQIGFYPAGVKVAAVVDAPSTTFYVTTPDLADTVFTGSMSVEKLWTPAEERARLADFSALDTPGTFVVNVPDLGISHDIEVAEAVHEGLAVGAIKAYYFQRASTRLMPEYAGRWTRSAGHPDSEVRVHASAATATRPEGTIISVPKGWYDAGDYNKYIVNSGISTGTLLMLYEHYPEYLDLLQTNIPESDNGLPDLLDEILWNVRWMMAMQDPDDGGIYHKLSTANFEGAVMPSQATQTRYVVQKSTPAALDFAAVAAIASRLVASYGTELPGLSDSLLAAAGGAWNWAQFNPYEPYSQSAMNQTFDPNISTGEYGDGSFFDEFRWAAAELFITTGQDSFLVQYPPQTSNLNVPGWPNVNTMPVLSLVHHRKEIAATVDTAAAIEGVTRLANQLVEARRNSPYGIVMGSSSGEFFWGSNSLAANQAMILLNAYRVSQDQRFLDAAISNLDYLLGRNATGFSFVTEFGDRTPHHPHHRQSQADAISDPVPGLLVGGPNSGRQDGCTYPSTLPAKSYTDQWCSYASNEIAINWNAPLAYVVVAIEAAMSESGLPVSVPRPWRPGRGANDFEIEIFPNPSFFGEATVRASLDVARRVSLRVYDVIGREVAGYGARYMSAGRHDFSLDVSSLPTGFYVVRVDQDGAAESRAFVVAR